MSWPRTGAGSFLLGLGALALVTLPCFTLGLGATPTAFVYLIVVVALALVSRFLPLAALSVLAVISLNYFFVPPRFAFTVPSLLDAIELGAFLITALVTTRLVSRSTRAARLSEERARLLDLTHDAVIINDIEGQILYWNRGAEQLWGWSAEQALGRRVQELMLSNDLWLEKRRELLTTAAWQSEVATTTRDRRHIEVAVRSALERDESGQPIAILVTANDITKRKRTEEALRASEVRFRTLVDHASDAFCLTDEPGNILDVNRQACESLGYTREELIGKHVFDIDPDLDLESIRARIAAGETVIIREARHHRKDGTTFPVEARLRIYVAEDGRPYGISLVQDITGRKKAEQTLREAQAALAHVTRVTTLGEVTASFAHEINQPLAAIVNNASACRGLLASGRQELGELQEVLADIVADAERASAIIERVRALAKRSASEQTELLLYGVVNDVLSLASAESASRRVSIRTDVPADLPVVMGDRVQLQQVLLNLVVNAMDAMASVDEAERRLEIRGRLDTEDGGPGVTIRVEDRGIGVEPEEMGRLFEAFYTTKPHGMGLGLAISRSIIEAHGGRLWAESVPGRGAVFSFRLPAAKTSAAA